MNDKTIPENFTNQREQRTNCSHQHGSNQGMYIKEVFLKVNIEFKVFSVYNFTNLTAVSNQIFKYTNHSHHAELLTSYKTHVPDILLDNRDHLGGVVLSVPEYVKAVCM